MDTIYSTVDQGKTYIAINEKYLTSINSYNNCFTQIFAWIFDLSITVDFNGTRRSIEKKSYIDLVGRLTGQEIDIKNIGEYTIFQNITQNLSLSDRNIKMREMISEKSRKALFHKLAQAIAAGDTNKALLLIGKGAELDTKYYARGENLGPSFLHDSDGLNTNTAYSFKVLKATPILVAASKLNQSDVVKQLKKFGADISVRGVEYNFAREIKSVTTQYRPDPNNPEVLQPIIEVKTEDNRANYSNLKLDDLKTSPA